MKHSNIHPSFRDGFTLIELLVVISIIGILSTVVLSSLNSARNKAKISAFKEELTSLRPSVINACDNAALVAGTDVPAVGAHSVGTINTQSCSPSGANTFNITFTPTNSATCVDAVMTDSTLVFNGC